MSRETIIDNEYYTADLDYQHDEVWLHCDVWEYNKDVLESMTRDWMDIEEALREHGFKRVFAMPEKTGFMKHTGWDYLTTVEYLGRDREVYLWDLQLYQS